MNCPSEIFRRRPNLVRRSSPFFENKALATLTFRAGGRGLRISARDFEDRCRQLGVSIVPASFCHARKRPHKPLSPPKPATQPARSSRRRKDCHLTGKRGQQPR